MKSFFKPMRALSAALFAFIVLCSAAVQAGGLYVFGDSLSDSGNNAIASQGGDPQQLVTGNTYVPQLPYASGVYSNGDVWISRVAGRLKHSDGALPSLLGGNNFAFGGARASTDGQVPSATTQLNMYLARGYKVRSDDVFVIAVGGNDLRDTLFAVGADPANAQVTIGTAARRFATALGAMVDTLQARGARHVLVWNTPNLGLVPAVLAQGAQASGTATLISGAFNSALAARLAGERGVSVFDLSGTLGDIVARGKTYGFTNVTDAAGAATGINPDKWLFWDGIHPTAAGHQVLARAVLAVWPDVQESCDRRDHRDGRGRHDHERHDRDEGRHDGDRHGHSGHGGRR